MKQLLDLGAFYCYCSFFWSRLKTDDRYPLIDINASTIYTHIYSIWLLFVIIALVEWSALDSSASASFAFFFPPGTLRQERGKKGSIYIYGASNRRNASQRRNCLEMNITCSILEPRLKSDDRYPLKCFKLYIWLLCVIIALLERSGLDWSASASFAFSFPPGPLWQERCKNRLNMSHQIEEIHFTEKTGWAWKTAQSWSLLCTAIVLFLELIEDQQPTSPSNGSNWTYRYILYGYYVCTPQVICLGLVSFRFLGFFLSTRGLVAGAGPIWHIK